MLHGEGGTLAAVSQLRKASQSCAPEAGVTPCRGCAADDRPGLLPRPLLAHLELAGVHAVVAFNEGVTQVVDAELVEALQGTKIKVQVVRVPCRHSTRAGRQANDAKSALLLCWAAGTHACCLGSMSWVRCWLLAASEVLLGSCRGRFQDRDRVVCCLRSASPHVVGRALLELLHVLLQDLIDGSETVLQLAGCNEARMCQLAQQRNDSSSSSLAGASELCSCLACSLAHLLVHLRGQLLHIQGSGLVVGDHWPSHGEGLVGCQLHAAVALLQLAAWHIAT